MSHPKVVAGTVVDVGREGLDHVLTVECEDGETLSEACGGWIDHKFSAAYGTLPAGAQGERVNVYTGDDRNPRHILRSVPLKTVGGTVLVPEDADLPVPMGMRP